jgi:hypothetical protein
LALGADRFFILKRLRNIGEDVREDFGVILSATLLGLLIGFSFSMAISRLRGGTESP